MESVLLSVEEEEEGEVLHFLVAAPLVALVLFAHPSASPSPPPAAELQLPGPCAEVRAAPLLLKMVSALRSSPSQPPPRPSPSSLPADRRLSPQRESLLAALRTDL